jgi:hypothetical protein
MYQHHRFWVGLAATALTVSFAWGLPAPAALASPSTGYLRVGHFVPGAAAAGVSLDGQTLVPALTFQQVTPYVSVPAGQHILAVTVPGADGGPAQKVSATETVEPGQHLTVLVTASATASGSLSISSFTDDLSPPPAGDAKVRFIDALASLPMLGGSLTSVPSAEAGDPVVVPPTPVDLASPYLDVQAGSYNVAFTNARTGTTVLTGKDWPVSAGTVASLVVLQGSTGPTLEVLKDAVGASSMPTGGMQTGAGGMALRAHGPDFDWLWFGLGLGLVVAVAFGGVLSRRTRRPVGLVAMACAIGLVASSCGTQPLVRATLPPTIASGQSGWSPAAPVTVGYPTGAAPAINLVAAATADQSNQPYRIKAPAVGIDAPIENLGRLPNGTMQVPSAFSVAGWYDEGPPPGAPGPAVIIGHVDNYTGPAVFWRLRDLRPGDLVIITSAKGTETFKVTSSESVAKATFPTAQVYGPVTDPELRLITCGGPFDRATGHYIDNTVVFASQIAG